MSATGSDPLLDVRSLTVGHGADVAQRDVSFAVKQGSIFAIMGVSGCGKSTLLRALFGLIRPVAGTVRFKGTDYWAQSDEARATMGRRFGVLFQAGALWSSLTSAENVALPLQMFTDLDANAIDALVQLKLSLVGLTEGRDAHPADLSGGMAKRVGLARALSLDPEILFLDEPSSGLDPVSAERLDQLIRVLRDGFGMTVVMVSHDLPSLFGICDDGIFLDAATHTPIAHGSPRSLRDACPTPAVSEFMHRGQPHVPA